MDIIFLPDLCLDKIFNILDSESLVSCYYVCERWRKIINSMPHTRETLSESIDVSAEYKNLPLNKLTKAKIKTFPTQQATFFQSFTSLTHLELDIDLAFGQSIQCLRNTLSSISLGPKVRHCQWVDFWKNNPRLEKLEVVSNGTLTDLPKTLKVLVAVDVDVACLQPCCESLTCLEISGKASGWIWSKWSFDRLKKLILGSSYHMPGSAPVLEYFEYRDPLIWRDGSLVRDFVFRCHSTLTDVIGPGLILDINVVAYDLDQDQLQDQLPLFSNLKRLSVESIMKIYLPTIPKETYNPFPVLKSLTFFHYNVNRRKFVVPRFPDKSIDIENLTVMEKINSDRLVVHLPEMYYATDESLSEELVRYLKTLCHLKSFEIEATKLVRYYLKVIPLSNLKRLRICNAQDIGDLDLSRFTIEFDELEINSINNKLTVILPSTGSIKDLVLKGKVRFYKECPLIKIERLTWNSFRLDGDFLRSCLRQGLSVLRVDTGKWETKCADSFFEALEDGLFAIYASIHKDFRKEFENKIKFHCPSVRICSFVCREKLF